MLHWTSPHAVSMQQRPRQALNMEAGAMYQAVPQQSSAPDSAPQEPASLRGASSGSAPSKPPYSWRWVLALCTAAIFICYADRSNISVAIVEMSREFSWDEAYQGTILSVFFLGYAGTQLAGGALADRYGGKAVLAAGVVAWSAFTFLTPEAAMLGSATLIGCRVAMGLGEVRGSHGLRRSTHRPQRVCLRARLQAHALHRVHACHDGPCRCMQCHVVSK